MPHCRVYNCNGHSRMKDLKLLSFPQDVKLAQQWLVLCRCELSINVEKYTVKPNDRVRSRHFSDEDFEMSKQNAMILTMGGTLKKPPKDDAEVQCRATSDHATGR